MKSPLFVMCVAIVLQQIVAPPPKRTEERKVEHENSEKVGFEEFGIEYERYLREVIDVLESDPDFKRKLEQAEEADIRTGKIAHELSYVDHNVRSKLDEVKRAELERLRHLAQRQYELTNGIDVDHMKIMPPEHLDHGNPHTFEVDDLKKLINKVTQDLNEADKKRREEFKEYEMQKEFENNEKLKHLEGEEKDAFEKQLKENETKHKQHEPLHHPGSKQQLEEVWEKQDHMQQEFNPKVFFQLHDIDGNGFWDQTEVKALFIKELDKMYQAGAPEDDMRERAEELERMREHVFRETDRNGDQLISYEEFLEQTKKPEFEKDPSWETVDQQPVYTHQEYAEFERRRMEEIQNLINQGLIPAQPYYHVPPGYHHPGMQQVPPGHHPQQQFQQHPNQPYHPQQPPHPGQQIHQPPPGQQIYQQPSHPSQQFQQPPSKQEHQQPPTSNQHFQQPPPPHQQFQQPSPPQQQQFQQPHPSQQQFQQPPPSQQQFQQPPPHQQQQFQQPPPHQQQQFQQPPRSQQFQQPPPSSQQIHNPNPEFQQNNDPNEIKRQPLGDSGQGQAINPNVHHEVYPKNPPNNQNAHPNSINNGAQKTVEHDKPRPSG